jgi:hypothetical protein
MCNYNGDGVNEDEEYVKNLGPLRFATMELVEMVCICVLCVFI